MPTTNACHTIRKATTDTTGRTAGWRRAPDRRHLCAFGPTPAAVRPSVVSCTPARRSIADMATLQAVPGLPAGRDHLPHRMQDSLLCIQSQGFCPQHIDPAAELVAHRYGRAGHRHSGTADGDAAALAERGEAHPGRRQDRWMTDPRRGPGKRDRADRKSTRLNSSHQKISYAVFW